MSEYHGCGDGGCVFGHPGGMHTNGGCRCLMGISRYEGPDTMQRVRKGIRALRDEVTALRAALDQERAKVERLAAMLTRVADALDRADCSEGYCMCGSPVGSHSWGDGHAPTDAGVYHKRQLLDEAAALLSGRGEVSDE